jgi:hypothetical protein
VHWWFTVLRTTSKGTPVAFVGGHSSAANQDVNRKDLFCVNSTGAFFRALMEELEK